MIFNATPPECGRTLWVTPTDISAGTYQYVPEASPAFPEVTAGRYAPPNRTPHKCPVCDGWGKRETWPRGGVTSTVPQTVQCHACSGSGVLWS